MRGREYRPKQTRLVIYLKNLDICYVDAWGCSEIVELLLQLVQRQGFYNDNGSNAGLNVARNSGGNSSSNSTRGVGSNNKNNNGGNSGVSGSGGSNSNLEWINVSGIQICGSISQTMTTDASANASFVKIAPRYLAINHMLHVSYPTQQDMLAVIQRHLEPLLLGGHQQHLGTTGSAAGPHFKGLNVQNVQYISEGLMEFYAKVCILLLFVVHVVSNEIYVKGKCLFTVCVCVCVFSINSCLYSYSPLSVTRRVHKQRKTEVAVWVVVTVVLLLTINFHPNL